VRRILKNPLALLASVHKVNPSRNRASGLLVVPALKRLNNNNNERQTTMKMNLTKYDIANALRADEDANWSANGALALASFLDENMPKDAILSVTDIRCEWSEYESLTHWAEDCFRDHEDSAEKLGLNLAISRDEFEEDEGTIDAAIRHYISENAEPAIEFDGGVIVPCF
jgi:hypothetical protein